MKKIYILAAFALLALSSCNYLDFDETSGIYTHDDIYKYYDRATKVLNHIYSYMPQDLGVISNAMRDCGCDDAEYADPSATVQNYNNGNWSALSTIDTKWSLYYGIRAANDFLASIHQVDLKGYELDPNYNNWVEHLKLYPYEARVLRAFYFFELARRYGDIPMPTQMLTAEQANSIKKTSFDKVVSFIVSECDECALALPVDFTDLSNQEYGRVTKGFAMAVKSKALLYAASALHNPDGDVEKWKTSALAALDIINSQLYTLDPGDKCNTTNSAENVLVRLNTSSRTFERINFPVRFTEGDKSSMGGTYPTQDLVDAFQTANGYDVTLTASGWKCSDPLFDPLKPYDNRDPRFYRTILYNGATFKSSTIETYTGGKDYSATRADLGTVTGYYLKKYIVESTSFTPDHSVSNRHHWVIYRYAETLLTYAESMVEAFGDPDYKDATFIMSAREALNKVRANASMPNIRVTGEAAFMEALRREWRVEFAFEDHRFWDIRRWKIGEETQKKIGGVVITKNGQNYSYSLQTIETRVWNDRMYLYPIPQSEIYCNSNLKPQNPGW